MATKQKLFILCSPCNGTGVRPVNLTPPSPDTPNPSIIECDTCEGKGHIYWGYLRIPNTPEEE